MVEMAGRQDDGRDGRQSLGDGRNCQGNRNHEHADDRPAVEHADKEYHRADYDGGDAYHLAEFLEAHLHGSLGIGITVEHVGDLAYLGIHTRAHYDTLAAAEGHHSAGERHILPVS